MTLRLVSKELCPVSCVHFQCLLWRKSSCHAASAAATREAASKSHPVYHTSEPQQRPRTQPKGQPHSPPAPPRSASMTPAIHAKLQQAHNKLLARPSHQEDTAAVPGRPSTSKPAPKKGRAAAQPDPAAGLSARALMALLLYADELMLPLHITFDDFSSCLFLTRHLTQMVELIVMSDLLSTTAAGFECAQAHSLQALTAHLSLTDRLICTDALLLCLLAALAFT